MTERKRRFRIALAVAGMTAADFAKEVGISQAFLSQFLQDKVVSQPLGEKIDNFIDERFEVFRVEYLETA